MTITCRPYQTEDDFWRMREFLRRLFLLDDRLERTWHVTRLDYAIWHGCANFGVRREDTFLLWEDGGDLVAFASSEGGFGDAHIAIDPAWRSVALEEEILTQSEERLARVKPDDSRTLTVWVHEQDPLRRELVPQRGYTRSEWIEWQWYRDLDAPIAAVPTAAGYTLRALGDGLELLERCYASGLGFHEGDIKIAVENRDDPTWYRNIQTAPLYRRDLDLVAVAPDGAIASFCTIWFDDTSRSAQFEPVATVPAHQRRGLARALMTEGLRRLRRIGCTRAFVAGFSAPANALYRSVMGDAHELYEPWTKTWQAEGA